MINMTGDTVAAAGRDTRLQVRNYGVAEGAIRRMSNIDRLIGVPARVVAVEAIARPSGHVPGRSMVDIAMWSQVLVGMAVQTVGRVDSSGDGVLHLLARAVMAGCTGTGAVGGDVMHDTLDLRPVRHCVAVAAKLARRSKGQVIWTDFYRVIPDAVIGPFVGVAVFTTGC